MGRLHIKGGPMKPKLVCVGETFLNGASGHHLPLFQKYFEISNFNKEQSYEKSTTFIYRTDEARLMVKAYENVCKFIADGIWEVEFFCSTLFEANTMGIIAAGHNNNRQVLRVPKWFWFEEHFSQQDKRSLITKMPFDFEKTKTFLMQIGDAKYPRVKLYDALAEKGLLSDALYSFLEYGIGLEGNFPKSEYDSSSPPFPQRAYRPEWYNQTNFTLVPESGNKIPDGPNDCFITEKTMKPIMYGHPFVVLGDTGTYQQLREWGFHTFPELFDESFDSASDLDDKIALIVETISKFKSKDVNSKIIDNFDLFWNRQVVEKYIVTDMIEPILKFINNGEIH